MFRSIVAKRGLSTLIPPKVVSPKNLTGASNAKRIEQVVKFYQSLPQGKAVQQQPSGVIGRYKAKFFDGDNASGKPILHLALAVLTLGYTMEYYFHLRHHKHDEHH
ncbi:hypothetical protein Kpol_440p1 [Vanderwaltozyma polyspora DSM 70294]|uniref:ATP synthase f chain, mitochondrial n=1 Tax=Vanderwaltozyma polyspora (strain ATCC 22028 / DSM 70294 / BCRC 21397 / CBS 2163 / NBRC 10782 / NRRL Y-8283 / UCD 57-17) TaxID=436907 RepID=A7TRE1_VANPO|nr:uncharacterized protein Kpol_440p1 [Vanderwaltozyma polyspora DSM 70294]EDO15155.1 hypothetical protein Kpol_440p1 [Vanderwaltozyma polyspora DSM 70294]